MRVHGRAAFLDKLFGYTRRKNILINVSLWVVMALGVLAASANTGHRRLVAIAIVATAFIYLTLHNTRELAKKKQDRGDKK